MKKPDIPWEISGAFVRTRIKQFKLNDRAFFMRLLHNWISANRSYCHYSMSSAPITIDDAPISYGERSAASILGGAAWMSGGVALTDYKQQKRRKTDGRKKGNGLVDLFFSSTSGAYQAEIKLLTLEAGKEDKFTKIVSAALDATETEAKRLMKNQDDGWRTAITIIEPKFNKIPSKGKVDDLLAQIRDTIQTRSDFAAWYFSEETSNLELHENTYYPGVYLSGRFIDKF